MKRILITFAAVLLGLGLNAQQRGTGMGQRQQLDPEEQAKRQTEFVKEDLGLNAEKEKKVYEVFLSHNKKMAKERENIRQGGDRSSLRETYKKMNEERDKELLKILGKKEFEKYLKMREKRRENFRRRMR